MKIGILENLFEDDILKIKFGILEFWKFYLEMASKIEFGNWNFWKIYFKMEF